ncbi:conserved hypothetical protein [Theileria orientalis strain Shintoku]|uniref:CPW-WPC domain-containing protein n=1 Tax=Theileria orientalis strain Shintoku TaxID=869250 RepID=J7MEH8_THEOR|nr:conserved hypothetical protein [Theileria orientalis strain Shintoku]BAM38574.1 conserved hypothetical protein [Theileria orientalis strain Shintoku]|eukprot:XP_009688875.1 conserved hypothetical protein [Theileria orientalis strain Shintoku]
MASESVPTQADVVWPPSSLHFIIDSEEMRKLDEKIKREESEAVKDHGRFVAIFTEFTAAETCLTCATIHSSAPKVRTLTYYFLLGWVLTGDGSCWFVRSVTTAFRGVNYGGNCASKQSFKWFSVGQKKDIEDKCCALWPRKLTVKEAGIKARKLHLVHGSVCFNLILLST